MCENRVISVIYVVLQKRKYNETCLQLTLNGLNSSQSNWQVIDVDDGVVVNDSDKENLRWKL